MIAALVALAMAPAQAAPAPQQQARPTMVVGHGNTSCGKWTQARGDRGASSTIYGAWLGGFISGINMADPIARDDLSEGTDFDGLLAWVDSYCAANPLDKVFTAAELLAAELLKRKYPPRR